MAVTFGVYVAGSFGAQGHLNPAVTIGFAYTVLPVPNKSNANWSYAWVPMLGPIVGVI